ITRAYSTPLGSALHLREIRLPTMIQFTFPFDGFFRFIFSAQAEAAFPRGVSFTILDSILGKPSTLFILPPSFVVFAIFLRASVTSFHEYAFPDEICFR